MGRVALAQDPRDNRDHARVASARRYPRGASASADLPILVNRRQTAERTKNGQTYRCGRSHHGGTLRVGARTGGPKARGGVSHDDDPLQDRRWDAGLVEGSHCGRDRRRHRHRACDRAGTGGGRRARSHRMPERGAGPAGGRPDRGLRRRRGSSRPTSATTRPSPRLPGERSRSSVPSRSG